MTRQTLSTTATRLFMKNGFDSVSMNDIADEAGVGRMTIFNHFPRKEDLFFDRDEEVHVLLRRAMREHSETVTTLEALRLLIHRMVSDRSPLLAFTSASQRFVQTIQKSETLKARVRAIRGELAQVVAQELAAEEMDAWDAALLAELLMAGWTVALIEGHGVYERTRDRKRAEAVFLSIVDRTGSGLDAIATGIRSTPKP